MLPRARSALVLGLFLASAGVSQEPSRTGEWPLEIRAVQRPGVYWWCPGSALDEKGIEWNLRQLVEAGIGTLHLIPIYGARGAEKSYIEFLSPRWMEMLDLVVRRAGALGLQVDMTTGTGWCFGGPGLAESEIDLRAAFDADSGKVVPSPGRKVKRAAPGGEGFMLDPYSPRAMVHYLQRFSQAFDSSRAALPRAQYHDSFEYAGDWSHDFLEEFAARRGYDLREHLAALFGKAGNADPEFLSRLKHDYRATLAELHLETMRVWVDWARGRGMATRNQAHGAPANLLDVYALSDIPETEMFGAPELPVPGMRRDPAMVREGDTDLRVCMLAASAAHVAHAPGRQLVAAEACTWLRENWHASLAQIKLALDLFFLAGVNHVFYHGCCYSPPTADWPGWFFYASTKMDWRNSIWRDVRPLNEYVARCQSVLQAGQPDGDVLLYWPIHDLWMNPEGLAVRLPVHKARWMSDEPVGRAAKLLMERGTAFDFVSDAMLASLRFEEGRLHAPGGSYGALLVPACRTMPAASLELLAALAEAGARVIFEGDLPPDVPGLAGLERRRGRMAAARERMRRCPGVLVAKELETALERAGVAREPMVERGLRFIRRRAGAVRWYFIANLGAQRRADWFALSVPFTGAELLDPMSGRRGAPATRESASASGRELYLQLEPGETRILRVAPQRLEVPPWIDLVTGGDPVPLHGKWKVEFLSGGPELPESYATEALQSWTLAPDPRATAFAGTARYSLSFDAPEQPAAEEWLLDLGDVRESARVRLNGKSAGARVALPFRLPVGGLLVPGKNLLEIEVTNLSANRIRDLSRRGVEWKIMHDINIVNVHYRRLDPAVWKLVDSGLLGPVSLHPVRRRSR